LIEEENNIELETRREVKLLRTEVERLKSQLEARCAEIQSIRDREDLGIRKSQEIQLQNSPPESKSSNCKLQV
jgi:hypothetical protein